MRLASLNACSMSVGVIRDTLTLTRWSIAPDSFRTACSSCKLFVLFSILGNGPLLRCSQKKNSGGHGSALPLAMRRRVTYPTFHRAFRLLPSPLPARLPSSRRRQERQAATRQQRSRTLALSEGLSASLGRSARSEPSSEQRQVRAAAHIPLPRRGVKVAPAPLHLCVLVEAIIEGGVRLRIPSAEGLQLHAGRRVPPSTRGVPFGAHRLRVLSLAVRAVEPHNARLGAAHHARSVPRATVGAAATGGAAAAGAAAAAAAAATI